MERQLNCRAGSKARLGGNGDAHDGHGLTLLYNKFERLGMIVVV